MKQIADLNIPEELGYTAEHIWARPDNGDLIIGISDFAQDQLGEVLFVDLPETGSTFDAGDEFGTIESLKSVSSLYTPVSGEIVEVNAVLADRPSLVNGDCYGKGWLVRIRPQGAPTLLSAAAYLSGLKN